ncbi:competence/damage-inducible protein A [Solimonas sp. K1W22B-7]|uniref:competence/damage-inducible protein A n=1 Tax=Solimonas sp. K1W22B-7 TaxID=2303331 RepID=UPI000E33008C|nr:competence/damage-inducible protein A [Solimonas sp. K1W22B-7]AXQ29041.1 competence/damage-inducible protein A [Solimonas sp. K1W22B-7]
MSLGLFVIGDEILSGKRQDKHLSKVIGLLGERGIALDWAQFLGDDQDRIAGAIAAVARRGDTLLSCGGIGATPDDCTRQAAAQAFGRPIARHPEAEALILAQYGDQARPNRVLMADFPAGAELIPNPVNRVAGFSVGQCYFVPGFPEMAWPMLEWVLDQRLRPLHQAEPPVEFSLNAIGPVTEGDLLPLMRDTLARYPGIKLSSLPFRGSPERPRQIEFGFKGPRAEAAAAYASFREGLKAWPEVQVEELSRP